MKTPPKHQYGWIAVLDALGASNYSLSEVARFRHSRKIVLGLLDRKVDDLRLDKKGVTTFTFNDTVVIVLKTDDQADAKLLITPFFLLLRKFMVDSMNNGIMFRGAVAEGKFYANDKDNIIMGPAVADAAAWYDKANWIGIHVTPRTSLVISQDTEIRGISRDHIIVDYNVPLSVQPPLPVKAVNWPRAFSLPKISPCTNGENPRAKLLELLIAHQIPKGTENKYVNTLAFFDFVTRSEAEEEP